MAISGVKDCGLPFRAGVESQNPLVSGDWPYLAPPSQPKDKFESSNNKKSGGWKPIACTVAWLLAAAAVLGFARGKWGGMNELMPKKFGDVEGFGQKCKWIIGKMGDGSIKAYNSTLGKLFSHKIDLKKAAS